jgi:3-hydroxybutyryl-CoA dehydrogenase
MTASIEWRLAGHSRSFPEGGFAEADSSSGPRILVVAGDEARLPDDHGDFAAVLLELGNQCLATRAPDAPGYVFGFARFRLGMRTPSDLIELVKGETADSSALKIATNNLHGAGFQVSVCADRIGRIIDRLIRPQFNLAYAAVDSRLATREGIESCVRNGLGYRQGLMDAVEEGGLEDHFDVCKSLFEAYGLAQYAPARQAIVARQIKDAGQ